MSVQVQNHSSEKVMICGVSETGKTTLWEKLIRAQKADFYIFFDFKDGDIAQRFDLPAVYDLARFPEVLKNTGIAIYDWRKEFPGKEPEAFAEWCKVVWNFCRQHKGRKVLGFDELQAYVTARQAPAEYLAMGSVGRTYQIDIYAIAGALNNVHNGARNQFTEVFAFRQGNSAALPYLLDVGFDGDELLNLKNGLWVYKHIPTGRTERGGTAFEPKNSGRNLKGL